MAINKKLKKGDLAVHTYYGIGKILGKETTTSNNRQKTFYRMYFLNKNGLQRKNMLQEKYIRPLASKKDLREAKVVFKVPTNKNIDNSIALREEILMENDKGTMLSAARIIRDLNILRASGKSDYWSESRLKNMKSRFVEEWSLIVKKDKKIITDQLKALLN